MVCFEMLTMLKEEQFVLKIKKIARKTQTTCKDISIKYLMELPLDPHKTKRGNYFS